jgi:hypothetical protein
MFWKMGDYVWKTLSYVRQEIMLFMMGTNAQAPNDGSKGIMFWIVGSKGWSSELCELTDHVLHEGNKDSSSEWQEQTDHVSWLWETRFKTLNHGSQQNHVLRTGHQSSSSEWWEQADHVPLVGLRVKLWMIGVDMVCSEMLGTKGQAQNDKC